jgi:hypothetical protein
MVPLFPIRLVPELNTILPLLPAVPPLELLIITFPDEEDKPSPETIETNPPVSINDIPEVKLIPPPDPLVPLPIDTVIVPARPAVAAPLPISIAPLLPAVLMPELKTIMPLLPLLPPFMVRIRTAPEVVKVPSPDDTLRAPPVREVDPPE